MGAGVVSGVPSTPLSTLEPVMAFTTSIHDAVDIRLAGCDQRYTASRRALIDALSIAGRPLTIPEILDYAPDLPQSSAYRNVTALIEVGVVRRVAGTDDHGRFELAEELSSHHHHLVCSGCGRVEDVHPSPALERAMAEAARGVAEDQGYEITDHQLDLVGLCPDCRAHRTTEVSHEL
jgi:Fe2+ or Zn2+ uptake regulation protein